MQGHRLGGDAGPARGHNVGQVDDLEGLDHPDERDRHRHRQNCRPGDFAEDLPAAGAVDLTGLDYTNLRNLARDHAGGGPGPESSILKIKGTEIEQTINGLLIEALGYYGAPHEMAMLQPDRNEPSIGPEYGVGLVPEQLLRRASSIYGGSNEIQKNIIAKMVLGL